MTTTLEIVFAPLTAAPDGVVVVFAGKDLALSDAAQNLDRRLGGYILKAAEAASFKGTAKTSLELLAMPQGDMERLIVVGSGPAGKKNESSESDWMALGGYTYAQISARKSARASILADFVGIDEAKLHDVCALLAMGIQLRHYAFTKYKTKKSGTEDAPASDDANGSVTPPDGLTRLTIHVADPDQARAAFDRHKAVANGILLARDLVNEPANALGPVEFADRIRELERLGLEIEILDVEALTALQMNTLLAVGQASARPSRVAIMQWHGAKSKRAKPLAFVGKGVVFDTGGYSMKPAAGMEGMKGDMGGAAAVTGLMSALAERKAQVNAIGIVGLVENMVSGNAIRPGDIITSMSGQTVEILNTDAEGRLILADLLWYVQQRFKPKLIVDLATLTGAIMIALGKEYAGLFCNDERLATDIQAASKATGEKVWRMPLDKSFHKLIDSKIADMQNIGGRWGGACTAAAFLERFIKDTPWAHLDIAGTAMDSPRTEISQSWGSGWGVRLLDRFVADHHEKA